MTKLFYAPGACSIGIHVLLEEIGKPYEAEAVSLMVPPSERTFAALNPKAKVPTVQRDDGTILTEFPTIAYWLAQTNPEAKLFPADTESQVKAFEAMDYIVSTVHMQGFQRLFRPGNFSKDPATHDEIKARGREIFVGGLETMDKKLEGREYVTGSFSIADAALFYVEFWAADRAGIPLPPNCAAHLARMKERPAVAKVLAREGFGS
jgi:glutathione S-transferase